MIELAIKAALKNPIEARGRNSISRFAAVLSNGKQTFIGLNQYRSHPLQAKFGIVSEAIHLHCEIDAIIKAIRWMARQNGAHYRNTEIDLSGYTMAVARVLKNGQPALAKPCEGCQKALIQFGVENVIWTE